MPTPPDAMTGSSRPRARRSGPTRSGPARVPSRAISVTTRASTPTSANSAATSSRSRPEPFSQPRTATSRPRASRPTATGYRVGQAVHERRLLERGGAEHDPAHPGLEERLGRRLVTDAPAGLHRHVDGAGDLGDDGAVDGAARCGRRRGRRRGSRSPRASAKVTGLLERVLVVHGLLGVVPLVETHAAAPQQVDGGEERPSLHVHRRAGCGRPPRTRRGRSSPTAPDFSGWNWVAHTGPRSTAAVTGPP